MKPVERSPVLRPFSNEHHVSMAWARRAAKACEVGLADAALAREVARAFDREIEPHFGAEELGLLPPLERAGERAHCARTLAEHAALRALAQKLRSGDVTVLPTFAEALRAHIRYEERELFARAEAVLGPEGMAQLDAAWRAMQGAQGEVDRDHE